MSLWKVFRYVFGVFVAFLVATLTSTQVNAQASCPPSNCTYGKDVGRDYFNQVVGRLSNVPASDFAVDALMAWKPYENTRACWNPLATTWQMNVCYFNCIRKDAAGKCTSGVQNYQDQATGVRATANTLNQGYYDAIRKMLRMEAFDREGMRSALGTWGTCSGSSCNALLDQWQALWNRRGGPGPVLPTVFKNGVSTLWQDQSWGRANLKVCADNLKGNTVNVLFYRVGSSWKYSQRATSNCVIFWDMDGAGPLNSTTYFSRAALNQPPSTSWPIPMGEVLYDSIRRP